MEDQHLISVEKLRAAGALDVPSSWRKSLGVERDLFTDLFRNHDARPENRRIAERNSCSPRPLRERG